MLLTFYPLAEANLKLLLGAIHLSGAKVESGALADYMSTPGNVVTKRAVEQQLTKLRCQAQGDTAYVLHSLFEYNSRLENEIDLICSTQTGTGTPKKESDKSSGTSTKKSTPRKKKSEEVENEDDQLEGTPKKRARKSPVKKESKVKQEDMDEDELASGKAHQSLFGGDDCESFWATRLAIRLDYWGEG